MAAVDAARTYICDHDGAAGTEIVRGLVHEENHPIGHNAAVARCELGDYEDFRRWWWRRMVRLGLKTLDGETPVSPGSIWHPTERINRNRDGESG